MSYEINPENFKPSFEVAGSIIETDGKIILLKRKKSKMQGNKWGIPSGKIKKNEDPKEAARREALEETGIKIKHLQQIKSYKVRHDKKLDFVYHLFYTKVNEKNVEINNREHDKAVLISPVGALKLNLVDGTEECIKEVYKFTNFLFEQNLL